MERLKGEVVWFNNVKGYGFIACEGKPDVFVHYSQIQAQGWGLLASATECYRECGRLMVT